MDWSLLLTNRYTFVCMVVMVASFLVLVLYYAMVYLRVGRSKSRRIAQNSAPEPTRYPMVSVVMVAHNEAAYLKESLPYLLEQDYPNYELVVVDYLSRDDTPFVLKVCAENYPQLRPVSFPEDVNMFQGKKYPLSIGIKSAKGDVVLLTDPDCVPKSFSWIGEMARGYAVDGVKMVAGFAGIQSGKGLLNALTQYDNLADAASWMGFALMGFPYSATGRNLSYRRDFFFQQGAFVSHYSEPEGADDMFVNQNATKGNFRLSLSRDAVVMSESKKNYRQWRLIRRHRFATKRYYSFFQKMLLGVHPSAVLLFYLAFALLLVQGVCPWYLPVALLVVKLAFHILSFYLLGKRFDVKWIHWLSPFFEIYFTVSNTIFYFAALSKKNIRNR